MLNTGNYLGVPHRTTEDIIYRGYLIPKGAILNANIWYEFLWPRVHLSFLNHLFQGNNP